mgnify:CR=1 FL=1
MNFIHHDGKVKPSSEAIAAPGDRGLKYGDGLFETMRYEEGRMLFSQGHMERMKKGMQALKLKLPSYFNEAFLQKALRELMALNGLEIAKVRLQLFRNEGLRDEGPNSSFFIETTPLLPAIPPSGTLVLYTEARKSTDIFSGLKHCNYLPYTLAALYAVEKKADDALVLNTKDTVADSTRANVFLFKNGKLFTPALTEGCVEGVFRKYLLTALADSGQPATEIGRAHV